MSAIIEAALSRSRTVLAMLLLLLLAGLYAYSTIPKESDPDINIPIIYASATYEGISPEDAERLLVRPLETELRSIEGVKEMRANAYQGGANVTLEFEAGFDADKALQDVRTKVDLARPDLPAEADEPTVNEVNFSLFPVVVVTLSGDLPERTLLRLARDLQDRLQALPQVLRADIAGDRDELVEVVIDPLVAESYGLDAAELIRFFTRSNRLVAAGNLDTGQGRFPIKVPGLFEDVRDIWDMPVKVDGDAVVRVRDIAEIRRTFKDPETFARLGGERAIGLEVVKRSGENIIDTIERVKAVVEAERAFWPEVVEVTYSQDRSTDIRTMLSDLQNNVISAVLLVMIVCIGALGLRSGLLVGVAIPGSFLTGILIVYLMGLTINVVVLFSLILAVGMLVDGAIIVTEFADRKMSEGLDRRTAYALASKRMAWPIIASTMTTLAAFLPLLFWPGVVGEFMKFLPITLIATLSASLAMALIFLPTLGAFFGRPGAADPRTMKALAASEGGDLRKLGGPVGGYVRVLDAALRHPLKILAATIALLFGVQAYYATHGNGFEFFPEIEPNTALVLVHARGNLSTYEKDALVREVEERVLELNEFDSVYTRVGKSQEGGGFGEDLAEDVIGQITVEFRDWTERRTADVILADIRERTAGIAGIGIETRKQEGGPPVGKPVALELTSRDPAALPAAFGHVRRGMEEIGGLIDFEDNLPLPGIEWKLEVDRAQAAKFGLDVSTVGDAVRLVTNGLQLGSYRPGDSKDEIDIVARYPMDWRSLDRLDDLRIRTAQGVVPVSNFVRRTAVEQVGTLERIGGQRVLKIAADVPPGTLADDKIREMRAWLEANPPPQGVRVEFGGQDEEQQESQAFLGNAFLVALFLIAVILLTQFNSFYSTVLILTAIVMSTIGVMLGLIATGQPFGIVMTGIGVIALAGIVVNNNIVLIDTYDHLKKQFPSAREAILRTGAQRLRPVMLTTVTTMLGLVPMALQVNIDFVTRQVSVGAPSTQWWTSLATAIVFGLGFSTMLTLVFTPCALMARADVADWRRRRREARAGRIASQDREERFSEAAE